jgi:tetratricopeptide (TPR) repeat protein/CHAT domain-containing protein
MRRSRALALTLLISLISVWSPAYSRQFASVDQQIARGKAAFDRGDYATAISVWQPALARLRTNGATRRVGALAFRLGLAYLFFRDAAHALGAFAEARAIDRKFANRLAEATDLGDIGVAERELGRYDDALNSYQQALAIARKFNDRIGEAANLQNRGIVERDLRRYGDARKSFEQALAAVRQVGDRHGEANALRAIGLVDSDLGRYEDALRAHQQAFAIDRELKDRLGEAHDLANLGDVEANLGHSDDALRSHQRALAIHRMLRNWLEVAIVLAGIGAAEEALGRYDDALGTYQQALAIDRAVKNRFGEAVNIGNIGGVEFALGRYDDALRSYRRALAIDRELKHRLGEGNDLGNIGAVEKALGRYDDALRSHQLALAIDREIKNRLGEADTLNNVGVLELALGHYDDARRSLQHALAIHRDIKNLHGEAVELGNIGRLEELRGHYGDALLLARRSVASYRRLHDREGLWRSLTIAASAAAHLNRRDEAIADYDDSLTQIETLRAGLAQTERSSFFSDRRIAYDRYIAYLQELNQDFPGKGYNRRALEVFERKEARGVLEQIARSKARRFRGVEPKISGQDEATRAAVEGAQQRLAKLVGTGADAPAITAAEAALTAAAAGRTAFEKRLQTEYPAYYALLYPRPSTVEELQHALCADEVLLAYDVLAERSVVFVVTADEVTMVPLQGREALTQAVARVRAHIDSLLQSLDSRLFSDQALSNEAADDLPKFAADSNALYQQLVSSAVAPLIVNKRLIIVPSESLYDVPWEALVTQFTAAASRYLLEDHAISYIPSGSLLVLLRATKHEDRHRAPLLAFANPTFGDAADTRLHGGTYADRQYSALSEAVGGRFPDLPGTAVEAAGVRDALSRSLSAPVENVITGADATKARLFSLNAEHRLANYRYLLFATHAVLPHEITGVDQPALVLAHPDKDGFVTMADVFGLSLDADFVALSACSTGKGARDPGEGISGLTRAFLYAGTPAISVTLWEVDDYAAPQITPPFFAAMSTGASPADALRQAKLGMLNSPHARFRHPFAWAPSVIFGDGDRVR